MLPGTVEPESSCFGALDEGMMEREMDLLSTFFLLRNLKESRPASAIVVNYNSLCQ